MTGQTPGLVEYPQTMDFQGGLSPPFDTDVRGHIEGKFYVGQAGTFKWYIFIDDSIDVRIDGTSEFLTNDWGNHEFTADLSVGWHDLVVDWH